MTRPRSQQINNLKTRHSRFVYTPTPESAEDVVAPATLFSSSVTDVAGGAESDTYAIVRTPSTGPFPIAAGDTFSIAYDSVSAVNVVLASTDTTASRIAQKARAALLDGNAFASEGYLFIHSVFQGSAGSVTLADVVPGTLAKLGLVAGTVTGKDAPARGLVTEESVLQDPLGGFISPVNLGGRALLRTLDGQNVVTDASSLILMAEGFLPPLRTVEKPGGVPVHARITWDGANFVFKYYATLPVRPEIETFGSSFSLLDGTDTFDISVNDPGGIGAAGPFSVTFPAGPGLTRDQVVSRINELWADLNTLSGSGKAHVSSTLTGPFTWAGLGDSVEVSVDGGAFQPVNFISSDVSSLDVANEFNSAVIGATATVNSDGTVRFASDNDDGTTSSLEFRAQGASYGLSSFFTNLGIQPGKYRGYFIAQPSGPSEIKLFGIGRGTQATLTIASLNPTTLARMGLATGTYTGLDEGDEEVSFPVQDPNNTTSGSPIVALIPEVMDFGEVQVGEESDLAQFENKGSGSARTQSSKNSFITGIQSYGYGILDVGKPSVLGPDGGVPISSLLQGRSDYERFFRQFIRGDFSTRTVTALVTDRIETPGTNGNPRLKSSTFTVDVDPDGTFAAGGRSFYVRFSRDTAPTFPFSVQQSSTPLTGGVRQLIAAQDDGVNLTAFSNSSAAFILHDTNMNSAGAATGGIQAIPATSGTASEGDRSLRILEKEEANLEPITLFRQVNARWTATCGDGTNSFGDFNGTDAIQQAIAFYNTHIPGGNGLVLQLKNGTFNVNPTNGAIVAPGGNVVIEGQGFSRSNIIMDVLVSPAVSVPVDDTRLTLRDVTLVGAGADCYIELTQGCILDADGVLFSRAFLGLANCQSAILKRCSIANTFGSLPCIEIQSGSVGAVPGSVSGAGPFTFEDCDIRSPQNNPVLAIRSGSSDFSYIDQIRFSRCRITLSDATLDVNNNLTGNPGVVDINPNGQNSLTGFNGAVVRRLEWIDCDVNGPSPAGGNAGVLMHLIPIGNGDATAAAPYDSGTDPAMRIDEVVIRGGHWKASRGATVVNPFTIGLAVTANNTDGDAFGRVTIKDWRFEFNTDNILHNSMGSPTEDVGSFFTTTLGTDKAGPPAVADWGAVAISAMELVMRDCELLGFNQNGDCGDLFLKIDRRGDIDGIVLDQYQIGTSAGTPNQRIRTRFGTTLAVSRGFPNVSMRRILVKGANSSLGLWCNNAIWYHEPSATPVTIKDSEIDGFLLLGANHGRRNFQVVDAGQGDLWGFTGNTGTVDQLTIDGLRCARGLYGITINRITGIDFLKRITIRNCILHNHTNRGLEVVATGIGVGAFNLLNNFINGNNPAGGLDGATFQVGDWSTSDGDIDPSYVVINGNQIYDNTNSGNGIQLFIAATSGVSQDPIGAIFGNNFTSSGNGYLKIYRSIGGVPTALQSPVNATPGAGTPIRGVETGYQGETAAGLHDDRYFVNNEYMINNAGRLQTP